MNDARSRSAVNGGGETIAAGGIAADFAAAAPAARADPQPLTHREKRLIVISMMLPVFLGSVDQSILATALPTIGRRLGEVHNLPWLITAFLIAATALTPLYGKFADIHGRRAAMLIGLGVYMTGSLICAASPTMTMLICGRVVQGCGAGGLDRDRQHDPRRHRLAEGSRQVLHLFLDRVYHRGRLRAGFGRLDLRPSALVGDLSVEFAAVRRRGRARAHHAAPATASRTPAPARLRRRVFGDGGKLVVHAGAQSRRRALSWLSSPILALLGCALVLGTGFVARLLTAVEPLIPVVILADPAARLAIAAHSFGWGAIISLNIFLPMYLQSALGWSATSSGLRLMILMVMLNTSAGLSSQLLGRVRHYKLLPLCCLVVGVGAVVTLAFSAGGMSSLKFEIVLFLIGVGFGPTAPLTQVALQNTVPVRDLGAALGTMNFARTLIGTILIAVFGAIVLAKAPVGAPAGSLGHTFLGGASVDTFAMVFLAIAGTLAVSFLTVILLEEKPLEDVQPGAQR